jgi:hypothetical protein
MVALAAVSSFAATFDQIVCVQESVGRPIVQPA